MNSRTSAPVGASTSSSRHRHTARAFLKALSEPLESRLLLSIANVTQNHYDASNDGQYPTETLLTPSNVNTTDFGRIFDTPLDGQVFAQPLAVANINITRGSDQGVHNVLYVATMHDSLFAVDATTGEILWQDSFLQITDPRVTGAASPTAGVSTLPGVSGDNAFVNGSDIGPELGILATPAISVSTNTIYVNANTQEYRNGSTPSATFTLGTTDIHYVQRLWAINLSDGSVAITPTNAAIEPTSGGLAYGDTIKNPTSGSVPTFNSYTNYQYVTGPIVKGTGNNSDTFNADGTVATTNDADGWTTTADPSSIFHTATPAASGDVAFNALLQMNRVAVTLINGTVYVGFASHGDDGPYYGWLLGFSATTLANVSTFVTVPMFDGIKGSASFTSVGGLWGAGAPITTDGTYLYFAVGNGSFNPATTNFSANYTSSDGSNTVQMPIDGDYGDNVLKVAVDPNATQSNVNLANSTNGTPTPDGHYDPDSGYNSTGVGLKVVDFFAPSNIFELNKMDEDTGSGGVVLIPPKNPQGQNWLADGDALLMAGGKEGRVYLIDAGNLGGFNTQYIIDGNESTANDPSPYDRIPGEYYPYFTTHPTVQANNQTNKVYENPSYYNGDIYTGISGLQLLQIPVSAVITGTVPPGTATGAKTSVSSSSNTFGSRGTTSAISSNGTSSGIIWSANVAQNSSDDLLAYNFNQQAVGIATTLYDSQTNASRDSLTNGGNVPPGSLQGNGAAGATGIKFGVPTIFNGLVYEGTGGGSGTGGHAEGAIVGYGLLPTFVQTGNNFASPTGLAGTVTSSTTINLTWTDTSSQEDEFEIQRAVDGGGFSVIGFVQHGVQAFTDTTFTVTHTYQYRVVGVSGGTMTLPANGNPTSAIFSGFSNVVTIVNGDQTPTVANPASANPNPVTGTTTALSVLGADNNGESGLTYTWSLTGFPPAGVSFSINGTNASKNTTATFFAHGTYTFMVTITNGSGLSVTSSVIVTVNQTLTGMSVTPGASSLAGGQTEQFTATALDQFGGAMPSVIHWFTTGGTITNSGLLTAPSTPGLYTITAKHTTIIGTATVAVGNTAPVITTAAQANPNPVASGSSTSLSVGATDDDGPGNLSYTWSLLSQPNNAAAAVFGNVNGTNAGASTPVTLVTAGSYLFHVTVTDEGGLTASANVAVTVSGGGGAILPAVAPTVTASNGTGGLSVIDAFNGTNTTGWTSASVGRQVLQIDLGGVQTMTQMNLVWGTHYARSFSVQVSVDGNTWSTIYYTTNGAGGISRFAGFTAQARYVRLVALTGSFNNYRLKGFSIFAQ